MAEAKTVGIIGGLGPAATVDIFAKLVAATKAERDQDHLRILIDNNPRVPNRNDAIAGKGPTPGPQLAAIARGLEASGADFIIMACNTAHYFAPEIKAAINVPFLSMVDVTVEAALERKAKRVGVLAADGCVQAGLYQKALASAGVEPLVSETQSAFMDLVYRIKAGDSGPDVRARMQAQARALTDRGADLIIAACTEVPLVLSAEDVRAPFISSTDVLVERTLKFATT